eukprot:Clim_evm20s200 gene=Clim_evmTU20s200
MVYKIKSDTLPVQVRSLDSKIMQQGLFISEKIDAMKTSVHNILDLQRNQRSLGREFQNMEGMIADFAGAKHAVSDPSQVHNVGMRVEEHEQNLCALKRNSQAAAKVVYTAISRQAEVDKAHLLGDYRKRGPKSDAAAVRQRIKQTSMLDETHRITRQLQESSRVLAAQVQQSSQTTQLLGESSKTLNDTYDEMLNFTQTTAQSKDVIDRFRRREFTDRVLLGLATTFFLSVCLYILWKRGRVLIGFTVVIILGLAMISLFRRFRLF